MKTSNSKALTPLITSNAASLVLAPMEGITDAPVRSFYSERGGLDFCVSEFIRVTDHVLPNRVFQRLVPESQIGWTTPSGCPVVPQLLGGNADTLAGSACALAQLGARAIDLNFGCPAPTVNRHDGGATLLKHPKRIRTIVTAVRQAVPKHVTVSAKLRLGWESIQDIHENALQAALGGADWITIHARTRMSGYSPPVYWKEIARVRENLKIPIIANGDIFTVEDFRVCQDETGCIHFMIGRGALAHPPLVHEIAYELGLLDSIPSTFSWSESFLRLAELCRPSSTEQVLANRVKQWTRYASRLRGVPLFEKIKTMKSLDEMFKTIAIH